MPKKTSQKIPAAAAIIRTYTDFYAEVEAFGHGERNLLIVVGPPGTSKSTAVKVRLTDARVIEGGSTAYRLYQEIYEYRDLPIVLDDADKVFRHKDGVFLLKLLTQTEKSKTIQWNSQTAEIRSGDLPSEFTTSSRTLIIANSWPQDNEDIKAIESRGHVVYFAPSFAEMHAFAARFGVEPEVYDFIGEHLADFHRFDLRIYFKAAEQRKTDLRLARPDHWKDFVLQMLVKAEHRVALQLLRDPSFGSHKKRADEFHRITGKVARTFYRYQVDFERRRGKGG